MSAHVLLNLLNEFGKKMRCEALPNEFNKFSNTGAQMQRFCLSYGTKIAFY